MTESQESLGEQLRREREDSKALRHALAISGESIRELARELDKERDNCFGWIREHDLMKKAWLEERRQHEETKLQLETKCGELRDVAVAHKFSDERAATAERELKRLKRIRRK